MSYQHDRDRFIASMTREGLPVWVIELLLRAATGINRRAELACSSEAADRDRVKCPAWQDRGIVVLSKSPRKAYPCLCDQETYIHPETKQAHPDIKRHTMITRITLQDWRAEERIRKGLTEINDKILMSGAPINVPAPALWEFESQGDPRGYCLRVIPPSYAVRNHGRDRFNREAIGVPCRPSGIRW